MNVCVCQTLPDLGTVEKNVNKVNGALNNIEVDIVVLPELFNSGYQSISKEEVIRVAAEILQGYTTRALIRVSRAKKLYILAGLAEKDSSKICNSGILIGLLGYVATYRKAHLFFKEKLWFDRGNTGFEVYDIGI